MLGTLVHHDHHTGQTARPQRKFAEYTQAQSPGTAGTAVDRSSYTPIADAEHPWHGGKLLLLNVVIVGLSLFQHVAAGNHWKTNHQRDHHG
jgi:hypothetical protein